MLYLSFNSLSGSIPAQLYDLSQLRGLYLSNNTLSGKLFENLGGMTALDNLWLDENSLSGQIPDVFDQLVNLGEFCCLLSLHTV